MPLFNYPLFWILLFILQLIILSATSTRIFNKLYLLFHRIFKNDQTVVLLVSIMFLPGTFIHELCHAMMAVILGSGVRSFSIWPKVEGDTIKMGYAEVEVLDIFRNSLIGTAPLIIGSFLLYYFSTLFLSVSILYKIILVYFIFQIANSMFLSPADVKEVRILFFSFVFTFVVLYIINFYYRQLPLIPQDLSFLNFLNIYLPVLKVINYFMLFPLILNVIIFSLTSILITHKRY